MTKPPTKFCSCGCIEDHIVWRRKTFDDKIITGWSDGMITFALGIAVRGAGAARAVDVQRTNVEAAWVVADEICLYAVTEVAEVVRLARRAARRKDATRESIRHAIRSLKAE